MTWNASKPQAHVVGATPTRSVGAELYCRVRQLGWIALLGIGTIALGGMVSFGQQIHAQLFAQARQGAAVVDEYLLGIGTNLDITAKYLATTEAHADIFRTALVMNPTLQGLYLVRPDGVVLEQQNRVQIPYLGRINDQPWLGSVRKGDVFVGAPRFDGQPLPHLVVAVPVPNAAGSFAYSLVSRVELSRLWTQLNQIRLGQTGRVFAVCVGGRVTLHHKPAWMRSAMTFDALYPRAWFAGNGFGLYETAQGGLHLVATARSLRSDLRVIAYQPLADLAQGIALLAAVLLFGVVSVLWIVWRSRQFTRSQIVEPLAALSRGAGEYARENMAHRTGVVGQYEFAHISASLDQMAQRLSTTLGDLQQRVSELDESTRFAQAILDSESNHIAVLDVAGYIVQTNAAWKRFALHLRACAGPDLRPEVGTNYLEAYMVGLPVAERLADGSAGIQAVLEGLLPIYSAEYCCDLPHEKLWFTLTITPLATVNQGAVVVHADITARKLAEHAQSQTLDFLRKVAESVPGVMYQYRQTVQGRAHFPYISPRVQIFGLTPEELHHDAGEWFARLHPDDAPGVTESLAQSAASLVLWRQQFRIRQAYGEYHWFEGQAMPELDSAGCIVWFGYFADIQTLKDTEERIRSMALHDPLTGLPNRSLFDDRVASALTACRREQSRFGLMFLDLDKFKPVNDRYGHRIGDLLLQEVAMRLCQSIRASDTAARLGGDEFVALLRHVKHVDDAMLVAEKVRAAMDEPFPIEGHDINVSASIGLAMYPDHGTNLIALTHCADTAMYVAKQRGRNTVAIAERPLEPPPDVQP
ncbi:GGDEF domain protein [Candidatus Symbiobacter mobilis CR]|uniref:GGDEF domain protein n=2 Tax=Candidatus Symbiobacter TaxID=1436289 RepID=U5N5G0_9BURK|nr:GGDEF domain protein [Candidatus Symbiobacter mobilis CR]